LSFATWWLQITLLEWLRQSCDDEFLMVFFLVFGALHFPFKIAFERLQIVLSVAFAARSGFGTGFGPEKS